MAKKQYHHYVLVFTSNGPVYVTKVNYSTKTAEWNREESPLEMTLGDAKDLHFGLSLNFNQCVVVTTMYELEYQPYNYRDFNITFEEKEK